MKCNRCGSAIEPGEEREHMSQIICEDCYMDVLSPVRTSDPWAVYSAKSFEKHSGGAVTLTNIQSEILRIDLNWVKDRLGVNLAERHLK